MRRNKLEFLQIDRIDLEHDRNKKITEDVNEFIEKERKEGWLVEAVSCAVGGLSNNDIVCALLFKKK